jgi:6-phosphogluconolactonase
MVFQINNVLENLKSIERAYSVFKTCDVIVLGMGEDGHTASLFPNDLNSELAFETTDLVVLTNAPKMPIHRISCSPFLLNSASNLYLMITGRKKKLILDKAIELNLPLGEFIPQIKEIYYTDKEL